jgi:MinD-like ATPase involved in chromosome partitioning or flagellar assembly
LKEGRNKFVCFAAGKGGVGKSIVSANVAYAAAMLAPGRVVAISADPGSKTLEYLVEGGFKPERGWVEYLNDEGVHIAEVMIRSKLADNLYVVYSSTSRAFYSQSNASKASRQLTRLIEDWNNDPRTSLAVVDAPAGRTKDHLVYASVFDTYLVTTPSRVDLRAAEEFRNVLNRRMFELFKVEEEVIEGVVANMVSSKEDVREIREHLDLPILGVVPYSPEMEKANREKLPIVAYRQDDPASRALAEIARKLLRLDVSTKVGIFKKARKEMRADKGMLYSLKEKIKGVLG